MKDLVIVPLNRGQVLQAGKYCDEHTVPLPPMVEEQLRITEELSDEESIMATSASQCAWLMSLTQVLRPARVLELGTFTGVGALAFYEATKRTNAEIVTVDMSEKYLRIAKDAFKRHGATDRITVIKGNCLNVLHTLEGQFDLIYVDAEETEYEAYTRMILDHKLLSPRGVLIIDDTLLEGLVFDRSISKNFPEKIQEPYLAIADKMNQFNRFVASDPRITATLIPAFNGVTQIMWK
ncbi:S-adenosyl-L-methionine-dependent methyltransferase [Aspergillus keveii]|uniref:S-adenosyl-L-methionine-dependent methyltransferase n=1 Tax=Aspergillus keveii TaxID=714993 RepID=A0ABR4FK61_9EURO